MRIVLSPIIRLYCLKIICTQQIYKERHTMNSFLAILNCSHFSKTTTCRNKNSLNKFRKLMAEIISTFTTAVKPEKP